jgi:U3 small nucleolar RNA-associated protein 5
VSLSIINNQVFNTLSITMSTKRKIPAKLGQPAIKQSAKVLGKGNLNESKTVVTGGGNATKRNANSVQEVVSISSDSDSSEEGEEEGSEEESGDGESDAGNADVDMKDTELDGPTLNDAEEEEGGEPSFGDLVRANAAEPIDVAAAFEDPSNQVAFPTQIQAPSGASLGTVLTQALRTNDIALLESCLHTSDVNTIRATIQRLESPLAGRLLQKLADRLHRRPGRAGSLMVWVQWTLVTHGGYLATQRDLIKKLEGLNRVIEERAKGLQSLLSLKGKLDMLEAQIELRRSMQNQHRKSDEDESDQDVIYVEGQESDSEEVVAKPKKLAPNGDLVDISDNESEISEDMPTTNGVIADSEEDEESSDEDGLLDDEAEETDADTGDEDEEINHTDQDSEDDDSEDGVAPPAKMQRVGGMFSKKR